ncbi:MAG: AAA family ATPase [Microscillaceae bacterium]|nr:AAA family ATPase [Microscillaceae bacterium]MDW8461048.1 AAA family ATPase [Cytophagales bacterium]
MDLQQLQEQVRQEILRLRDKLGKSQAQIATQVGISGANITQIVRGNWESISEALWRKVAIGLGLEVQASEWHTAEIGNYKKVFGVCGYAQAHSLAKLIAFEAGFGKTYALQAYTRQNRNVFYLQCERHYTRKVFLQKFGQVLGLQLSGGIADMIDAIIDRLKKLENPLVIWDEYDKVLEKQGVFDLFKTFYDATLGHCGFVLCGTNALEIELRKRAKAGKIGYQELFSRCGREFVSLQTLSRQDITLVCEANGIDSPAEIEEIRVELGDGDLRQLKDIVQRRKVEYLLKQVSKKKLVS